MYYHRFLNDCNLSNLYLIILFDILTNSLFSATFSYLGARLLTRLNDVFALSEGTLMVVPERPSNLKMKLRVMGEQYQATSFWIANRIFYCESDFYTQAFNNNATV